MKRALASAIGGGLLAFAVTAHADEPLETLLEQNVVSSASKTSELAHDAPATVSVLTDEDIHRYGIRTLAEAIDFLGMGMVTQDPLNYVEIGGRGVQLTGDYGIHVLLLVDGHVINDAWAQSSYYDQGFTLPLELIDHVEMVLGPGSVLYGANAMLAVVNVTTKSAAHFRGARVIAEGTLTPNGDGTGGSYRVSGGAGHELTLFGKKIGVTAQIERFHRTGPPLTFARETVTNADGTPKNFGPNTPLGVWGGTTSREYDATVNSGYARFTVGDFTFATRAATFERGSPYDNFISRPFGDFDDPRSTELDRWLSFDARWEKQLTSKLAMNVHANLDSYDFHQRFYAAQGSDCSTPIAGACIDRAVGVARWAGIDAQATYDWTGDDRITSLAGAYVSGRTIGAWTETDDATTKERVGVIGNAHTFEMPWAMYAQQRWSPISRLHLNAGLRFDDVPRGGTQLSPRAAASLDTWRGGTLKAIYSQAFRGPTFFETQFVYADQVAAPHLRSEKEKSAEATLEQRFGRHSIVFGVFRTWWTDLIALHTGMDGVTQYQNIDSLDNYGYNARAEGAFGDLRYGLSITGAHTRRTTPEGTMPLVVAPQVFGNARISYAFPGNWPTVAVATAFMGPRLADRAFDGGFPATPGVGASLRTKLTLTGNVPRVRGLTYRAGIDYTTAPHTPYVAGPIQSVDPGDPAPPRAQLAPVIRLTALAGLAYEF